MGEDQEHIERTLAVFRQVAAYTIPPRMGSGGVKSGEWRTDGCIFTGRLMVVDCGSVCELRLSDGNTGELFATCPLRIGERMTCVEPTADSSRNFVIRVVNPTTKRHAFLGMGFPERDTAFDFNVTLSDWEKHATPSHTGTAGGTAAAAAPQHDFSLKAGETIKVKPVAARGSGGGGGLLSSLGLHNSDQSGGGSSGVGFLSAPPQSSGSGISAGSGFLPPPPLPAGGAGGLGLAPPPAPGTSGSIATPVRLAAPPAASSPGSQAIAGNGNASGSVQQGKQPAAEEWTAFS